MTDSGVVLAFSAAPIAVDGASLSIYGLVVDCGLVATTVESYVEPYGAIPGSRKTD